MTEQTQNNTTTAGTAPAETPKPRKTRGPYNTKKRQAAAAAKQTEPQPLIVGVISQGVQAIKDVREMQQKRPPFFKSATAAEKRLTNQLWATLLFLQELHGQPDVLADVSGELGE